MPDLPPDAAAVELKRFHLGALLTVIHGFLLAEGGVGDIYEILNWVTNDNLFTHQLPRAGRVCEPFLKEDFPSLSQQEVEAECQRFAEELQGMDRGGTSSALKAWLSECSQLWGEWFDVPRLPVGAWIPCDPLEEDILCFGGAEVLIVQGGQESTNAN